MGNVIPIGKRRKTSGSGSAKPAGENAVGSAGHTLCRNGHHRWKVCKQLPFDLRQRRLVTVYRCERCGKQRSAAT